MSAHGIEAHPDKAIDAVLDETVIGVDMVDGRRLAPNLGKSLKVLSGLLYFLGVRRASRLEVAAALGHLAWFALLSRPTFSGLHCVYEDARDNSTTRAALRAESAIELSLFLMLLPWIEGDLTRPWSELIVASDASPSFGFGVSVAHATPHLPRSFARIAARQGAYARLGRDGT